MTIHQHATIADTVYFWFGSNDTSGSGDDGAAAASDVRLAGAAAGAAPVFSPVPTLLTHANYPDGCYEIAVAATVGNGFAAGNTYAVFCTLTVDAQNPTGFVGSFVLAPIIANITELSDDAAAAINLETAYDGGAYNVGGGSIVAASVAGTVASVVGNVGGDVVGNVQSDVQGNVDGSVASVTGNVGGNVVGSVNSVATRVTANTDQIEGVDATDQIRDAILDDATRFSGADIDAAISTRATPAQVNAECDTALSDVRLDELIDATAGGVDPTVGSIADQMMNADGGQTFSQATDSLEAVRNRGDAAWETATTVTTVTGNVNGNVTGSVGSIAAAGIAAASFAANAITAAALAADAAQEIADTTLGRNLAAVAGAAARSLLEAVRFLRNRWIIAGGVLTVYEEDDITPAWTANVSTAVSDPVDQIDPV